MLSLRMINNSDVLAQMSEYVFQIAQSGAPYIQYAWNATEPYVKPVVENVVAHRHEIVEVAKYVAPVVFGAVMVREAFVVAFKTALYTAVASGAIVGIGNLEAMKPVREVVVKYAPSVAEKIGSVMDGAYKALFNSTQEESITEKLSSLEEAAIIKINAAQEVLKMVEPVSDADELSQGSVKQIYNVVEDLAEEAIHLFQVEVGAHD